MFRDREEAGERLADLLEREGVTADLVLAVPRGGLPVGRAVADRLGVPLGVVAAKKLGAPGNPELAVGAVADDGTLVLNEGLVADLGVGAAYVEDERARREREAREKVETYGVHHDVAGERVLVVDDGVATGATTRACLRSLRQRGAAWVALAVPVAPPGAVDDLRSEADAVYVVETPASFGAVGAHYRDFRQVSDEEARRYL